MAKTRTQSRKRTAGPAKPKLFNVSDRADQLLELQRRALNRYAEVASLTAQKLTEGDLNLANWATDYAAIWSNCGRDLDEVAKMARSRPATSPKGDTRKHPSSNPYGNWLALQESLLGRVATYFDDIGQLVVSGSAEPRKWIDSGTTFWRRVLTDTGDWVHRESGDSLRPTGEWLPLVRGQLKHGREEVASLEIHVSIDALPDPDQPGAELTIEALHIEKRPKGLARLGGGILLELGKNVKFVGPTVSQSEPSSQLKLYNLPLLRKGDVYVGLVSVVWADGRTRYPAAMVEVEIV
jgi:hypothetical protein